MPPSSTVGFGSASFESSAAARDSVGSVSQNTESQGKPTSRGYRNTSMTTLIIVFIGNFLSLLLYHQLYHSKPFVHDLKTSVDSVNELGPPTPTSSNIDTDNVRAEDDDDQARTSRGLEVHGASQSASVVDDTTNSVLAGAGEIVQRPEGDSENSVEGSQDGDSKKSTGQFWRK
jgi:hypothetical protein